MKSETNSDALIDEMKRALDVETDRELAEKLGVDPSTVATWRRRESVPAKYRLRLSTLVGEMTLPWRGAGLREAYLFSLVRLASVRLTESVHIDARDAYREVWYGFRIARFYAYADRTFRMIPVDDRDGLKVAHDRIRVDIDRDDFCEWIETLPGG